MHGIVKWLPLCSEVHLGMEYNYALHELCDDVVLLSVKREYVDDEEYLLRL